MLLTALTLFLLGAQLPSTDTPAIHVDVDLVQIVVTVTDAAGHYVTNLRPQDFVVEMDGVPQEIAHFSQDAETPVSLGLVIDTSISMKSRLPAARQAASTFIRGMRQPDEFFLMSFARGTRLRQDFTQSRQQLDQALASINGTSWGTNLVGAVEKAAARTRSATHRKRALIVISDGGDNSRSSLRKFQARIRADEVLMYAIEIQGASTGVLKLFEPSAARRTGIMHSIAEETGGRWFGVDASLSSDELLRQLDETFAAISAELRGQYSIGFYPSLSAGQSPGKVRVRCTEPEYRVRARK